MFVSFLPNFFVRSLFAFVGSYFSVDVWSGASHLVTVLLIFRRVRLLPIGSRHVCDHPISFLPVGLVVLHVSHSGDAKDVRPSGSNGVLKGSFVRVSVAFSISYVS